MTPIDQLFQPLTSDQVFETLLTTIETYGVPARSWRKGGALRTILRAVAFVIATFLVILSDAIKGTFLDSATGRWLSLLATYVYGVTRLEATFANGTIRFDNTGGGAYSKAIGEARVYNPATNKSYTNTEAFTIAPLETNVLVAFQAVEAGAASSSAAATITEIETTMLGVQCTNPDAIVGSDAERDPELRQACRDSIAAISPNGARAAHAFFARRAKRLDGQNVNINRVTVVKDSSNGVVKMWVASPSGAPVGSDVAAVQEMVDAKCVPSGQRADVFAAVPVSLAFSATIFARKDAGLTAEAIKESALAALVELQRNYPIGGMRKSPVADSYLFSDKVAGAIVGAAPEAVFDVDGVGGDLPLAEGEVATLVPTLTVQLVSGAA